MLHRIDRTAEMQGTWPSPKRESASQRASLPAPPVIVRLAGLPGEKLADFASPSCLEGWRRHAEATAALASSRGRVVEELALLVPRTREELRRFLLAAKRDAFNGRSFESRASHPDWEEVDRLSGGLLSAALDLERCLARSEAEFASLYVRELERERAALHDLASDQRFLRGISLGSPDLVSRARELRAGREVETRHARKAEQSLLRYLTRAAAKLSPYSTLTTLGLGLIVEGIDPGFRLLPDSWRELSLVRADCTLLQKASVLLLRHPQVRGRSLISLNDTLHEVEEGRFRLLRKAHWSFDESASELRFVPAGFVRFNLSRRLAATLRKLVAEAPLSYDALVQALRLCHPELDDRVSLIDRMVELGLLFLLPPWYTSDPHPERRILEALRCPSWEAMDPALETLRADLEALVELEREPLAERKPEVRSRALGAALAKVASSVEAAAGTGPVQGARALSFYEDVFTVSAAANSRAGEVLHLSAATVRDLLGPAESISAYAGLMSHRHDLLHTLAAFWRERWPARRQVGLQELYQEFQTVWNQYLRWDLTERYDESGGFDPFGLPASEELSRHRRALREGTLALLERDGEGMRIPAEPFSRLVQEIPERYRPLLGCSVFLQPADPQGRTWVLNRLFEGSGRYLSRYPPAMESPMREAFVAHLAARSSLVIDGEPADLVDLAFTQGSTANLRLPQTRRVLELPGEQLKLSPGQRVRLGDLRVEADLAKDRLRLVDGSGRRLIPVHLSSLNSALLPALHRFLSVFGPYEVRQNFPRSPLETEGPAPRARRLTCGSLVVRRERWELGEEALSALSSAPGSASYLHLQEWRRRLGLPQRVFIFEQMHAEGAPVRSYKPQYIDFSSPSLAALFAAVARKNAVQLIVDEPLPCLSDFPSDRAERSRALEIQIDTLALGPISTESPISGLSERRTAYELE